MRNKTFCEKYSNWKSLNIQINSYFCIYLQVKQSVWCSIIRDIYYKEFSEHKIYEDKNLNNSKVFKIKTKNKIYSKIDGKGDVYKWIKNKK